MLSENAKIEQWIYIAGGTKEAGKDNANFGVWSASDSLISASISDEIHNIAMRIAKGDTDDYLAKYRNIRKLKPTPKPGLFGKYRTTIEYKASDKIERAAKSMLEKNISFNQQNVIV